MHKNALGKNTSLARCQNNTTSKFKTELHTKVFLIIFVNAKLAIHISLIQQNDLMNIITDALDSTFLLSL